MHVVPFCSIVHDRVAVEIQRGCAHGCRFCQAGFVSRPTRQRGAARVLETARRQLRATGYQDASLLSLSAGDHPQLQEMLAALLLEHGPCRVSISLPSLRTESLHPEVARQISQARRGSFTLAPEAATDRLRRVINKRNTEQDLLASLRSVAAAGYSHVKLYFMIGLPTETDEDVLAIAELATRAQRELESVRRGARVTVSVSTFVPKPHTPFQWERALDAAEIRRRHALLVSRLPRRIRVRWHDAAQSVIEAVLARADRRMSEVLDRLVDAEHVGLDAWSEHFDAERWLGALDEARAAGQLPELDRLLGPRAPDAGLPWDHIDVGVSRDYLVRQRELALVGTVREDCTDGSCDQCGVCPEEPLHRLATEAALPPVPAADAELAGAAGEPPRTAVRLHFGKRGRASLLGHLEMAGAFERAARRAGLALAFSSGFRPHPRMRFSPALPLGVESECELVELELEEAVEVQDLLARLAPELPPGLTIHGGEPAVPALLKRIIGVTWLFEGLPPAADRVAEVQARLARGPVEVSRRDGKVVDVGAVVIEIRATQPTACEIDCRFGPGGTVRPRELLNDLLGLAEEAAATRVTRLRWLLQD